jgi:hypothetical protein
MLRVEGVDAYYGLSCGISSASGGSVPGSEGTVTGAKGGVERCWRALMSLTVQQDDMEN